MEYLVTMTTHVPDGTSEETVEATRQKEAARSRQLAAEGHLRRLWRPPLRPGEWRTLGLFAANGADELEQALASMPLRVWRTDEVTPLASHPDDPPGGGTGAGHAGTGPATHGNGSTAEFFTTFDIHIPNGTPSKSVDDTEAREAKQTHELARQGHLERLWTLPAQTGHESVLGLWRSADAAEMKAIVEGLPMANWMTVDITPLSPHPNDPASVDN
jgi:muconolactone delta-isomerase